MRFTDEIKLWPTSRDLGCGSLIDDILARRKRTDKVSRAGFEMFQGAVGSVVAILLIFGSVLAAQAERRPSDFAARSQWNSFDLLKAAEKDHVVGNGFQTHSANVTVPFFMYEPDHFLAYSKCSKAILSPKHTIDVLFVERLQNHPWRTSQPQDAELFVVPVLLSALALDRCNVSVSQGLIQMKEYLERSPWYTRYKGRDHLVLMTQWQNRNFMLHHLGHTILIGSYTRDRMAAYDNVFVVGFLGNYAAMTAKSRNADGYFSEWNYANSAKLPRDLVVRWMGLNRYFQGSPVLPRLNRKALFTKRDADTEHHVSDDVFLSVKLLKGDLRSQYPEIPDCNRTDFVTNLKIYESIPLVGRSPPVPSWTADRCVQPFEFSRVVAHRITERSHFSFLLAGDNPESDTLYNAIATRSIPVLFVEDEKHDFLYECMVHFDFPWKDIALMFSGPEFREDPMRVIRYLRDMVQNEPDDLARRVKLMDDHARDLVWSEPGSRVHEKILIDAWKLSKGNLSRSIEPPKMRSLKKPGASPLSRDLQNHS
ncbi:hypothetical protein FVE85_2413 [Porphyridium purpureum]|uniref:Exostosin GT47 domain-containing protein n=1 Tax=Porphyridium purpureum TaxID=35688 RepID=A0A5J4YYR3_PORPP|nr:hypothetical protein FVE85_2413 [Porphyridium purpureum]|eukprot:POR6915..scf209_3